MFENLNSLGITHPEEIDRYNLRHEAEHDILKIYLRKDKGEFFAKSVKFKYSRQPQTTQAESEMNPKLSAVIAELDQLRRKEPFEIDIKHKILDDLRHLEAVVSNKIAEIEADLDRLTRHHTK